jgi:hypothetical protein
MDLAVRVGGRWRPLPFAAIRRLERLPDSTQGGGDYFDFAVTLASGESFRGELPRWCDSTWLAGCEAFEIGGESRVLGTTARFVVDVADVRSLAREADGSWTVVDATAKSTRIVNPRYRSFRDPPDSRVEEFGFTRVDDGGRRTAFGQAFEVVVGHATVEMTLAQVERITFVDGPELAFRIRMRNGEEADGRPSHEENRIERGFGRLPDGSIWFDDLAVVRSISFGPIAARK